MNLKRNGALHCKHIYPLVLQDIPCRFIIVIEIQVIALVVTHCSRILHDFLAIPKLLIGWNVQIQSVNEGVMISRMEQQLRVNRLMIDYLVDHKAEITEADSSHLP